MTKIFKIRFSEQELGLSILEWSGYFQCTIIIGIINVIKSVYHVKYINLDHQK